jgi:hypothetical protein
MGAKKSRGVVIGLATLFFFAIEALLVPSSESSIRVASYLEQSAETSYEDLPREWLVKKWKGPVEVKVIQEKGRKVLRVTSYQAGVSLHRGLTFNVKTNPVLSWEWKVSNLSVAVDAPSKFLDTHPAGVYLMFPRFPALMNSQFIGYIWSDVLPVGAIIQSPSNSSVFHVVVRTGSKSLGSWVTEERDVVADYEKIFGQSPSKLGGISLILDSADAKSERANFFGSIDFNPRDSSNQVFRSDETTTIKVAGQKNNNKFLASLLMLFGLAGNKNSP